MPAITAEAAVGRNDSLPPVRSSGGWLFRPWLDLIFVANVAWPLVMLVGLGDGFDGRDGLQFWQIYYVTTPHRWITFFLVFLDPQRIRERPIVFGGIAVGVLILCLGVRFATGALTCLLAVDFIWNAWHFAAQHHGIYRIYCRLGQPPDRSYPLFVFEKWAMRGFVLYTALRVVSATLSDESLENCLRIGDWIAGALCALLVLRDIRRSRSADLGRTAYLISMSSLYLSLLWAVHERETRLILALATASALFHAVEYISVVSWSVIRRQPALAGDKGSLGYLAPRWGIALISFVLVIGLGGWLMDQRYAETWLTINVMMAFLHYAYDGLIWRRRPAR